MVSILQPPQDPLGAEPSGILKGPQDSPVIPGCWRQSRGPTELRAAYSLALRLPVAASTSKNKYKSAGWSGPSAVRLVHMYTCTYHSTKTSHCCVEAHRHLGKIMPSGEDTGHPPPTPPCSLKVSAIVKRRETPALKFSLFTGAEEE